METLTDDELTALALAADPDVDLGDDAVSLWDLEKTEAEGDLLPSWYMPSPMVGARLQGWKRSVGLVIIVSFLLINAAGLCSTYGWVGFG